MMRSMRSNGPGKMTGRENREISFQTERPSATVTTPGHQLMVRRTPIPPPPGLRGVQLFTVSEDQRVFLLCGHFVQHAVAFGHAQKLPFGIGDLLIPTRQKDPLFSKPFFVGRDRCGSRYARERPILLDGSIEIFRLAQPSKGFL